jgi:hypothetical protein
VAIWKAGAIRDAVVINGDTDAGIKCWLYPESNPTYVLSRAGLIFGSGYVDCTNAVRTGLTDRPREAFKYAKNFVRAGEIRWAE